MKGRRVVRFAQPAARGFSLIELLVALTIVVLLVASIAVVVPAAHSAFELTPLELDLQQRSRTAIDVIANAIRTSGGNAVAAADFAPLSRLVPRVVLSDQDADGRFTRLKVVAHHANAAQGVLDRDQAGPSGALSLAAARCPAAATACGFARDASALIADGTGRFDVFTVAAVDAATRRLTGRRSLSQAYPAGSFVLEVDADTFHLEAQPDGSRTLVRVTAGGAVQPVVDRVSAVWFEPFLLDVIGSLVPMPVGMLTDGPWLRGEPDGDYDADSFVVKRVGITLTLQPAPPAKGDRTFRFAVNVRNTP